MTVPYEPLVSAADLGVYLDDDDIDQDRAELLIQQAQQLCSTIVSPLPAIASVVVMRVAGRAYVTITSSRSVGAPLGIETPFGASPGGSGAVFLSRTDETDLRRMGTGGAGAFSIDMLPAGYTAPFNPYPLGDWDQLT